MFGKKKIAQKTMEDRELVAVNAKKVEALKVLAEGNEEMLEQLAAVQEKLKYLIPSEESKVCDADKKIGNLLGDLRIALVKSEGEVTAKATDILADIKLAIADRNTKL